MLLQIYGYLHFTKCGLYCKLIKVIAKNGFAIRSM